jgi:phage-related protein
MLYYDETEHRRPLYFIGSSRKDLRALPDQVQDEFGWALLDAQFGDHPQGARPFGEGLPGEVMKLVQNYDGDTYRAAYTVSFPECVYLLHVFKKKSCSGIATPRPDLETIRSRLAQAKLHYRLTYRPRSAE